MSRGTPRRTRVGTGRPSTEGAVIAMARAASPTPAANRETQSKLRDAGTTPWVLMRPRVGLSPTTPQHAAGTRPEPAVSVPNARATIPVATAIAEPALEPPAMKAGSMGLRHGPKSGARVPTRPVANWSRFVLP